MIAAIGDWKEPNVNQIANYMKAFNDYLEAQIIKLGGNADEN